MLYRILIFMGQCMEMPFNYGIGMILTRSAILAMICYQFHPKVGLLLAIATEQMSLELSSQNGTMADNR